jgi:hypothetical protein
MAVIDSVSQTLVNVLNPALDVLMPAPGEPFAQIHDLQNSIPMNPSTMTVFLYDVFEDPSARNRPRIRQDLAGDIRIRKPDMALQLRYLLTPWSQNPATEQAMLSVALQTFYDNAIIEGPQLAGDLQGTSLALKVSLALVPVEDRTRVWYALQRPYKVSLLYEVRVVPIPTLTDEEISPVHRRTLQYGSLTSTEVGS